MPYDGVGRAARNGLNFTERGFGVRAALGVSDRGHTAVSQLAPGDVDWERIFGGDGARWFHCGGIFCALSDSTAELALEAMAAARRHGTIVSYDLNYRPSLWKALGGPARAAEVNRRAVELVDVLVGNEEDFGAALGYEVEGVDASLLELDAHTYEPMLARVMADYDQLALTADAAPGPHGDGQRLDGVCRTGRGFHVGPRFEARDPRPCRWRGLVRLRPLLRPADRARSDRALAYGSRTGRSP